MRYISIILFFILSLRTIFGQEVRVDSKYHSPLGIPLKLNAIFGDIRPNHFHMGLDFKTNQKEGISIYSISEGYISRIKISPNGYGRVIYIDHPNGITSVYAHCSAFSNEISNYVLPKQVEAFSNDIDIKLEKNEFPVKKGDFIAFSGNSGSSTGPHLHFELRETTTEHALNPLLHGFSITDAFAPSIEAIKIYAVDEKGYQIPGKSIMIKVQKTKNGFTIPSNKIILPKDFVPSYGQLAFSVSGTDRIGSNGSNCGLFENICLVEKDTLFHSVCDRISFDDSRFVNSHQDYDEYKISKTRFHKLFKTEHNPLNIYRYESLGTLKIKPKDTLEIEILLKDVSKNYSKLSFSVVTPNEVPLKSEKFYSSKTHFLPDSAYHLVGQQMKIDIEPYSVYEPIRKFEDIKNNRFGSGDFPIQKSFKVEMNALPNVNIEQQFIQVFSNGKANSLITERLNGKLNAETKLFGIFSVKTDTIAPKITPLNFKETDSLITKHRLIWKVTDSQTDIRNYNLLINGEWYPLEYDLKSNRLIYVRNQIHRMEETVEVLVSDNCGNIGRWKKELCLQ
jgi:hypothetical protein